MSERKPMEYMKRKEKREDSKAEAFKLMKADANGAEHSKTLRLVHSAFMCCFRD